MPSLARTLAYLIVVNRPPRPLRFHIPESLHCGRITRVVEGALLGGQRTEQPVEQKEADAEVLVHQSAVVQHPVMDVMPLSCAPEPSLENVRCGGKWPGPVVPCLFPSRLG